MLEHLREALEEPASEGWEAGLTGEVRPTLRPVSKGNVSGTGFSGFLPGPSIPLSGDHGSWQRWQLPVGGCPITHPPGVLPRATEPDRESRAGVLGWAKRRSSLSPAGQVSTDGMWICPSLNK